MKITIENESEKINHITKCFVEKYDQSIVIYINTYKKWKVYKMFCSYYYTCKFNLKIELWFSDNDGNVVTISNVILSDLTDKEKFYFSKCYGLSCNHTINKDQHYTTLVDPSIFFKENKRK